MISAAAHKQGKKTISCNMTDNMKINVHCFSNYRFKKNSDPPCHQKLIGSRTCVTSAETAKSVSKKSPIPGTFKEAVLF